MNITKTQVFKIDEKNKVSPVKKEKSFLEKDIQKIYEDNLEELLGIKFIETEYAFDGGRIDTFGIDEDMRPTIIEYKRGESDSVLLQALFYKNFLTRNNEKAWKTFANFKDQEFADQVDFDNIRVIIIAESYDKWTVASTSFLEGVDLYTYSFFEGTLVQDFVNESKKTSRRRNIGDNTSVKKINENEKNNQLKYDDSSDLVKELYSLITEHVDENFEQVEISYLKKYWSFKTKSKFMEIIFKKDFMKVQLLLSKDEIEKYGLEDMSGKGHWGSLKSMMRVETEGDLSKLIEIIKYAYNNSIGSLPKKDVFA